MLLGVHAWWNSGSGPAGKVVDMTGCGFVAAPVITITLRGNSGGCPAVYEYLVVAHNFKVYTAWDVEASELINSRCNVHWTAAGYTCKGFY